MASIKDIARIAGTSPATVSRAFREDSNISDATRQQILAIAAELNYQPKQYKARSTNGLRGSLAGIIISCKNYPWANRIINGISSVMDEEHITPIFTNTGEDPYQDVVCIDKLRDIVSGIIVVPSTELNDYNTQFLESINRTIPVVTLIRNTGISHIDSVRIDSYKTTYDAVNILIDNGHQHIAIINGPMVIKPNQDRLAAYTEALRKRGIPIRNEYICYGDFNEDSAKQLTIRLLTEQPEVTAIFSSNTAITRGCLMALDELSLHTPEDIAFISYGDDFSFSLKGFRLTVISDPDYAIGQRVAKLLLSRMRQYKYTKNKLPQRIVVTPELILRGSEVYPKNRLILKDNVL